jgi:hypothetical protein
MEGRGLLESVDNDNTECQFASLPIFDEYARGTEDLTEPVSKRGRPRRDILEDLEAQGKVSEVILLAWGIIEFTLDNVILVEYGLSSQDPKSKPLLNLRISDKLRLQRTLGYLSEKEFGIIQSFKDERDALFHTGGLFFPNLTDVEKARLVDLAIPAADVAHELSNRVFKRGSDSRVPWTG